MIKKFWHVGLTVDDLDASIEQYKLLGFSVDQRFEKPEPRGSAAILKHIDGSSLELWKWHDEKHPQIELIRNHIAFKSDNIDEDVEALANSGCKLVIPKTEGVIAIYAYVQDPSGTYIEIAQDKD